MPRYFFHMTDELGRTSDHEGSYFRNEKEARAEAREAAKQLVTGRRMKGAPLDVARAGYIEVADEHGHVVFKFNVRMRGATPPATYELKLRESLFHGVQALRLTPIDSNVFGRAGLLAHTFMLGPKGDSNGCVSFKNYDAFLQAYLRGEVKRLAVVARLN